MDEYSAFATLLNRYLADQDRSAAWLAQRLQVHSSTVTRWCNGETRPNAPETVIRVADILGVYDRQKRQELLHAAGYGYLEGELTHGEHRTPADAAGPAGALASLTTAGITVNNASAQDDATDPLGSTSVSASPAATTAAARQDDSWFNRVIQLFIHPAMQIGLVGALFAVLILSVIYQGRQRAVATVQHFAIGEWKNLSPDVSSYDLMLTEGTRHILYEKLSLAEALQGVSWESPQATNVVRDTLDVWIEGSYQNLTVIKLTADIFGRDSVYVDTIAVTGTVAAHSPEAQVCILDLQNQLAEKILTALNTPVTAKLLSTMDGVPTHSCEALRLNNDAVGFIRQGSLQTAQTLLKRALAIDPEYADAYNNLGQLFYRQGDWAGAVTHYQQAIALQSANAVFHYNLAVAYERQGDYTASVQAYQQALALDPIYVQALNNLGFTYLQQQNVTQALAMLRRGLELAPDAYYLHKNLGRVYLEQNDTVAAIQELQQAITLFGSAPYAEALYYLALAYQEQGQPQEACATLAQYLPVADKDEAQRAAEAKALGTKLQCATK